ncbi:MAG: uroporphyrinogen-III synthase [Sulfurimonas sp.]|jgi:uroporphyrinogen-III synthase
MISVLNLQQRLSGNNSPSMSKQIYLFSTSKNKNKNVTSIKSLDVNFLSPKIDFTNYDYLIITSKQTVKALSGYDKSSFINKPSICVSTNTSSFYEDIGGKILDIGNGYGDSLSDIIKKHPKTTRWLYLRAKNVASDFVQKTIEDGYNIDEVVLYYSECSQELLNVRVNDDSTLIFTSPSCVECFLKNNTIHAEAKIIAIGNTTAKALPKNIKYYLSNETSIDSCVELALKIS